MPKAKKIDSEAIPTGTVTYKVTATLIEPMLGTAPLDKEVYSSYIMDAARAQGQNVGDELETVEEALEKGKTGFHRDAEGNPIERRKGTPRYKRGWGIAPPSCIPVSLQT